MDAPILSVTGVSKHFGGLMVFKDISFDVKQGEVLGIMGPNGAGKSTLMNIISGQFKPDEGAVEFHGRNITALAPHKICQLGIARTYQVPQPFVNLTIEQNIRVAAEYGRGMGRAAATKEAARIMAMVGLVEKKDVFARDLAAVSLKRLELARALGSNPKLILLDEVAAGLTEKEIPRMLEILGEMRKTGMAYIMIEHVMRLMVKAVDRIIVMDKGAKIAEGSPEEVMKSKNVVEAYLGKSA